MNKEPQARDPLTFSCGKTMKNRFMLAPMTNTQSQEPLLSYFADLDRRDVRITAAGKIRSGEAVEKALSGGLDFVTVGRAAILHHDFPARVIAAPVFQPVSTPVTAAYLRQEGLSPRFVDYMRAWKGFVKG